MVFMNYLSCFLWNCRFGSLFSILSTRSVRLLFLLFLFPICSSTPTGQDNGICGFIAATNIHAVSGFSQWSCTTAGTSLTAPCTAPIWSGITCSGSNVTWIVISNAALSGSV